MKRPPRLTKRERKEQFGKGPLPPPQSSAPATEAPDPIAARPQRDPGTHIHCVACGKHLDTVGEASGREGQGLRRQPLWMVIRCAHGSEWTACMGCLERARMLLDEHDRTGNPVRAASAWH
jgi:hypothetical protein